jgi:hypothetical protein
MGFLSRLFRLRPKQTRLESFLAGFTQEMMMRTCGSVSEQAQVPTAICTRSLYIAGRFADGLRDMMQSVGKGLSVDREDFPFDVVTFEAAAFAHYWLMREALLADADSKEREEVHGDEAAFFENLKLAASAASQILADYTDFNLKSDLLMNRCLAYSFEERFKATPPEQQFSKFLMSSIQSRSPSVKSSVRISTNLPLQLCVATYIPIWSSTLLDELKKATRDLHMAD